MTDIKKRLASLPAEKRALVARLITDRKRAAARPEGDYPAVQAHPDQRFEPFPLTGLQQAFLLGRTRAFALGNLPSCAYLELECEDLDRARLRDAWQRLIDRHEMLRIIVLEDGTQRILEQTPAFEVADRDLSQSDPADVTALSQEVRRSMLDTVRPTDEWPLFDLLTTTFPGGSRRLHIRLDMLIVDAGSISILLRELRTLLDDPRAVLPAIDLSFRDYFLAAQELRNSAPYKRAREYWMDRVSTLPPAPGLPTAVDPGEIDRPRFVRHSSQLDPELTNRLKARARDWGISSTGLLLAAYADVVARWSNSPAFTINLPIFNRLPLHPRVDDVVGPFSSVNLLAIDSSKSGPFRVRAREIQDQLLDDLMHREFDGVGVQRELARLRGPQNAAMPVVFTGLLDHQFAETAAGLGQVVSGVNQTAQVWMDLHADEQGGSFVFKLDSVRGLFPEGMPESMLTAYCRLLESLAEGDGEGSAALLPDEQRTRRAQVNETAAPIPDRLVHDLFAAQARQRPDQLAIAACDRRLSYRELQSLATRIGRRLRESSARPDSLVAIVMEKGWEQIAAVFGILQSGAAFVPLDVDQPKERLWQLLEDAGVEIVLTQERVEPRLTWPESVRVLCVDRESEWAATDDAPLAAAQEPRHLAYVLYTSGSTGVPKGVMIEHHSLVNRVTDLIERFKVGPEDRIMAVTALHHDISGFDMFAGLGAGATVVVPDHSMRRDPAHWAELVQREGVTQWFSVPAFVEMFVEYMEHSSASAPSLRHVMFGGDWIPLHLTDRVRTICPEANVSSLGGPTETTLCDILYPIGDIDPRWKSIPYGKPLANTCYHVLDEQLQPCPDWVTGELYVGGDGLARGYWRDPERTREKFIEHPVSGARLYRSGDLGRYLPDGNIEFMGRADFQVKIQGQRIELGEIEAALLRHEAVQAAIVLARDDDAGRKRLVAYVVPGSVAPQTADLREHLAAKLPPYMLPAFFVLLDALPLTPNGKVDRKNLPSPAQGEAGEPGRKAAKASSGRFAAEIREVVNKTLKIGELADDASMIAAGANSIDLVRLGNELESAFGERPRIDEMFRLDSIAALAGYYDERLDGPTEEGPPSEGLVPPAVAGLLSKYRVLIDPDERDAFKAAQHGVRRGDEGRAVVELVEPVRDEAFMQAYHDRMSHRSFSLKPIPLENFSRWLSCLSQVEVNGKPRYRYASPGGLYPTQVYLHVKPNRVEGVQGGTYYYHPLEHHLVSLEPEASINRSIHIPFINTPIFDEAAFSVFLIARLDAIGPGYGDRSIHFVTIEAGIISHLLETAAIDFGLGLCQIGSIEFERVRELFHLDPDHWLVHSSLGGRIASDERENNPEPAAATDAAARIARMADRVRELSPDQVKSLLGRGPSSSDGDEQA